MAPKTDKQDGLQIPEERKKALNLAISQIEKQIGKGSIMRMGTDSPRVQVGAISTGAINLDAAIGVGGIPRGRITEIYGPESSGKTTLALHVAANAQKAGGVAAFIDAEHALDVEYAKKLGVDIENLLVSQPDTGEEALEIAEILVRSGAVDVIVVDSVAALVPKAEIEGDMGDSHVGLQARLMSQALRKLAGSINRSRTSVVFINQLREKIGVMFGNPETIRQAEFDIMFNEGISHVSLLVDIGAEAGIIDKSGAWYSYGKERIGQGRENAKLYLKDHPDIAEEIEVKVKEVLGMVPAAGEAENSAADCPTSKLAQEQTSVFGIPPGDVRY
jgi:recombination protein RecA